MVNTIETRGLGAGSYPEAPELPEEANEETKERAESK